MGCCSGRHRGTAEATVGSLGALAQVSPAVGGPATTRSRPQSSRRHSRKNKMVRWLRLLGFGMAAGAALWGCAAGPPPAPAAPPVTDAAPAPISPPRPANPPSRPAAAAPGAHYSCDQGTDFTVRFADDSAFIDSTKGGSEVVLRDAGGLTPQQSVYS